MSKNNFEETDKMSKNSFEETDKMSKNNFEETDKMSENNLEEMVKISENNLEEMVKIRDNNIEKSYVNEWRNLLLILTSQYVLYKEIRGDFSAVKNSNNDMVLKGEDYEF